jgi:hypothetical protein
MRKVSTLLHANRIGGRQNRGKYLDSYIYPEGIPSPAQEPFHIKLRTKFRKEHADREGKIPQRWKC